MSMPLRVVREDIVRMQVEALVNSANPRVIIGGGSDQEVHRAAGTELFEARRAIGEMRPGEARLTPGFGLKARFVIHVVSPIYQDGAHGERELLSRCYREALRLAAAKGCRTLATPLLGAGANGWKSAEALEVARESILAALEELGDTLTVSLAVFDLKTFMAAKKLFEKVEGGLEEQYVKERIDHEYWDELRDSLRGGKAKELTLADVREALAGRERSFMEEVMAIIDSRGWKDADVYKRAAMSRQSFSKLRGGTHPKKETAIDLALALRLDAAGAERLLSLAGYSLAEGSNLDKLARHFLEKGNYNVQELHNLLEEIQ